MEEVCCKRETNNLPESAQEDMEEVCCKRETNNLPESAQSGPGRVVDMKHQLFSNLINLFH